MDPRLLESIRISEVWAALGGGELRRSRGRAFWRHGDGYSVTLSDAKGAWFDFVEARGGGVLDLIQAARGCDRPGAVEWLRASRGLAAVPAARQSPEAARRMARQRSDAIALARRATLWRREACLELNAAKLAADQAMPFNPFALSAAAQALARLEYAAPETVLHLYIDATRLNARATAELVRAGEVFDQAARRMLAFMIQEIAHAE